VIELTLGEIAAIVAGRLHAAEPGALVRGPVEFDSRKVAAGGLFLALPGEHVDGHDYVPDAVARGAVAAVVTRPVDAPSIVVADGFAALAALASYVVRHLPGVTVIGITGSSGKTTTKDMLAQVLASAGATVAPPGSFNNELGHPYTVLRADRRTRFLVLETSARGIGHIRYLTGIAPPRIGVELNVGSAHLGEFGSREAIAQAKGELVEALPAAADGGVAVLNADDPLVLAMARRTAARVVTFGESPQADVQATGVRTDELDRPSFTARAGGESAPVQLAYPGRHSVSNATAALAAALECGVSLAAAAAALGAARPVSRWRMELTERGDGVLVVNDAYNANPESMAAALRTLADLTRRRGGRGVAVLGAMAELGDAEAAEHAALGRLVAELGIDRLIAVGAGARPIEAAAVLEGSWRGTATWVDGTDAAIAELRRDLRPGDVVLVKASRAASLERVAAAIVDDAHAAGGADGEGGAGACGRS
jgi:UDP-N-acetylmuramoyl-tripeptide--D-alanyl-D-alanine ligase